MIEKYFIFTSIFVLIPLSPNLRFLSTKYDSQKRWHSAAMRVSPALSTKMKKGKKHTANGHLRGDNYPMGKDIVIQLNHITILMYHLNCL